MGRTLTVGDIRFFVLRHGESTANVRRIIASGPAEAGQAHGLTERGRAQVRASVTELRDRGALPAGGRTRILSSPLLRARESAAIAAELLEVGYEIDARLVERGFGSLDLGSDELYDRVWARDRADPSHEEWGVESVASVHRRASALLADVAAAGECREVDRGSGSHARASRSPAGTGALAPEPTTVLLCTHGDVASTLCCAAAGAALARHREVGALGNAEIRELVRPVERPGR